MASVISASTTSATALNLSGDTSGVLQIATGATPTTAITVDASQNVLVGTTSSYSSKLAVVASAANPVVTIANTGTNDNNPALQIVKAGATNNTSQRYANFNYNSGANGNGAIAGNGDSQATFITLSDERLKDNIVDLPAQLDNVLALRPVEFDYKATGGHQIGFIAQEVQAIYPDLVSEGDDGYLTLAGFDKNTARLVKAIQELKAIVDTQAERIAVLEGK